MEYGISVDTKNLRVVAANIGLYGAAGPASNGNNNTSTLQQHIRACLEICSTGSLTPTSIVPITWYGSSTLILSPGDLVASDAVPNTIFHRGDKVWVRYFAGVGTWNQVDSATNDIETVDAQVNDTMGSGDWVTSAAIADVART